MNEEEKLKDLKAVYSGAVQSGEIGIANMIKGGIDLIEKLQKENEELEEINNELEAEKNEAIRRYNFKTIPIKKVKDKIEKLNQYYKKEIYPSLSQWRDITITKHYDEMIELLQEIIGDK